MSEHLNERLRRAHDLFRRDHDPLREELMAALPETRPEPACAGPLRRGWQWLGATPMRKRIFGTTAVAASMALAAFVWTPGSGSRAYGVPDVIQALRSAEVIHAEGVMYQPAIARPGQERTRCPMEIWIDRRNGRERRKSSWYRTDNEGVHVFLTEEVSDGQFVMAVNHTEETVEYARLNPFQRTLQMHKSFDNMLEQWFGEREELGFTNTGRETLRGRKFDLWRGEVVSAASGMNMRIEQWVAPDTREIGALKYWAEDPDRPGNWVLVLDVSTIERDVPIPPGTFDTTPPPEYTIRSPKDKAAVSELNMGGGLGLDGVWLLKHVEFALEDGSVLIGWSSYDERAGEPQDELFANLRFGGPVPKLPMEMYGLHSIQPDVDLDLSGVHLAHTKKNGRFYEWSLYVPDHTESKPGRFADYQVMFRINPPERKMRASGRSMCSPQIRIRNQADFDALVRGAMAELSDSGRAPAEITYERVLHLSRSAAAPPTQTAPEPR